MFFVDFKMAAAFPAKPERRDHRKKQDKLTDV